jgi:uncharacterized protein YjbJ (UPF0337 family)
LRRRDGYARRSATLDDGRAETIGATDETKGKLKEAAGSVTGSDDLGNEGQAQQEKGQQQDEAARLRAQAGSHEANAEGAQAREQDHQGT